MLYSIYIRFKANVDAFVNNKNRPKDERPLNFTMRMANVVLKFVSEEFVIFKISSERFVAFTEKFDAHG